MTEGSSFRGSRLQAVPCDLCGSSTDRTHLTIPDMLMSTSDHQYRIARCRSCDLLHLNPRPYQWDIGNYYPATYAPFRRSTVSSYARAWLHRRSVRELQRYLAPPNRVLDVGCGTGELLSVIRSAGNSDVFGVEPSPAAAQIARDERGHHVQTGTLEQMKLRSESIDIVLLSHVLEHLPSPKRTMREISRILKPGGTVIIWVPNARSMAARILGRYWMGWDVPRHFYAFTPGSLYRLSESACLRPGEILHEKHAIEWAWGVRLIAKDRLRIEAFNIALQVFHPVLAIALTPLSALSAAIGRSGRIRFIAHKPFD
jgi:SAM-dependent methyltransferase